MLATRTNWILFGLHPPK